MKTCGEAGGRTKAGAPCAAVPGPGKDLCLFHDPARTEEARAVHVEGGYARKAQRLKVARPEQLPERLDTAEDGLYWASAVARLVATGELDSRTGDVVLRALREHRESFKVADLQRRVRELMAKLAAAGIE